MIRLLIIKVLWDRVRGFFSSPPYRTSPKEDAKGFQTYRAILQEKKTHRSFVPFETSSPIARIFYDLIQQDRQVRIPAALVLGGIAATLDFKGIIKTEEQLRQTTSLDYFVNWAQVRIADLDLAGIDQKAYRAVLMFASFHSSGYIREESVQLMKHCGGTLPYILLRLNDWVYEVRYAANQSFEARMSDLEPGELLASLPYALKLQKGHRSPHDATVRRVFAKLAEARHFPELCQGLKDPNLRTRRICILALFAAKPPHVALAKAHLHDEREPFLRALVFQKLCATGVEMDAEAQMLLHDPFPANRKTALQYQYDRSKDQGCAAAVSRLQDSSGTVRALAQRILQTSNPEMDLHAFYLSLFQGRPIPPALLGLSETGGPCDAAILEPFLRDERTSMVKAAMHALTRIDRKKYVDVLYEKLLDARTDVVKTAQRLLSRQGKIDYARVYDAFISAPDEYRKKKCADILFRAPKWNRIIFLLEALSCEYENIQNSARRTIGNWLFQFNRSYVQITPSQKQKLLTLVDENREHLSPSLAREI